MDTTFLDQLKQKMQKSVVVSQEDLATIRTGRATPALIEHIQISAYEGSQHLKLNELATVTASDASTLLVQPFDPSTKTDIVKGIMETGSGLTPVVDGEVVRVTIPPLSEERRKEYTRLAKAKIEAGKVMIRQLRQDAMQDIKKEFETKLLTEDDKKRYEKQVQDVTDENVTALEEMLTRKEQELIQI